jgi:hypothetical protein
MLNYKLFAVLAIILVSGIYFDNAFAAAGSEYTPTQPNAFASYSNATNQIQVSWDFDTLPADTKCFLKGDVSYNTDLSLGGNTPQTDSASFIPRFYSPITASPVLFDSANKDDDVNQYAEEVSCTGETRIDIDTLMNHSQNTNNQLDMQIFLTFYAPVNGEFDNSNENRIDEVFVMYAPATSFNQAAKDYGCGGQIGSTLYIDASGSNDSIIAHGNNGDNCNEYLYLENNQYVDIGMDGAVAPLLPDGNIFYDNHVESAYSLLIQVVSDIITIVTHGGSDDDHNSRPTFGFDHKTFVQRVAEGLVINDEVYTVTDNYWTPMPMLSLHVGATQNFTATAFAPHQLKIMEFAFGIPEVGEWYNSEASIEIETNYDGEIISSEVTKNTYPPVINATSLESSVSKVKCVANDNSKPCYRVSVEFSFLEAPIGNVFGVQAIDQSRKNQILYFNDGLELEGESQNPPVVHQIISDIKYKGLQTIQRIDKVNDIWMTLDKSEPVLTYQQNDFGTFFPIEYRVFEKTPDVMTSNPDRLHSEFIKSIKFEQTRAVQYFDSALYLGQLDPAWSHDWTETDRIDKNRDSIELEKIRVLEVYEQMFPDYEKTNQNFKE